MGTSGREFLVQVLKFDHNRRKDATHPAPSGAGYRTLFNSYNRISGSGTNNLTN